MSPDSSLEIELSDVCYAHRDDVPLLEHVSLRLCRGWTGVVGPNGAGKTTLLRLLAGELRPDAGAVRRSRSLRLALCPQRVDACDERILRFAGDGAAGPSRLRGLLELDARELERWSGLSPGERKRWQVGAALADEPQLLLLDEPTNHLDASARELLVRALSRHRGIGLLVSHDRRLLAELTRATLRVHRGRARLYRGSYAAAKQTWEAEEREERQRAGALRREREQLTRRLTEQRARRDHAQARTRTSRRMKGPRDNATAGGLKMSRRRSAVNALGRDIRKLHGRIERLDRAAGGLRFEKERGRDLFVDYRPAPSRELLRLDGERLTVGPEGERRVLLEGVRVSLGREDRVWLSGRNGSGKSTLVRRLVAAARIPAERMLVMPQELDDGASRAALERARALPAESRGHLLQRVAALGVDPDALLASARPSPGEARKLLLAEGLSRQVWALLLDEPSNHLDLPSLERLELALSDYPGALLLVTHDEPFAARLATTRWQLGGGELRVRPLEAPQPGSSDIR